MYRPLSPTTTALCYVLILFAIFSVLVFTPALYREYIGAKNETQMSFAGSQYPVENFDFLKSTNQVWIDKGWRWLDRGRYEVRIVMRDDPDMAILIHTDNKTLVVKPSGTYGEKTEIVDLNIGLVMVSAYIHSDWGTAEVSFHKIQFP
jgi:hypothetical protein